MKKELKAKVEELANAFIVSETILRERLKLSNDALHIMLTLGIVDPEKASLLLEVFHGGKNEKNRVWVLEMKEKFDRIHRLMVEFLN